MNLLATSHLRIARPSHDLRASERFWVDGLGLQVLHRTDERAEGGHALLMLGWPAAAWHLELVDDSNDETPARPTEEDLLVLYLNGPVDDDVIRRIVEAGGARVAARNPYWDRAGVTLLDPDGYRLVLSGRSWPGNRPTTATAGDAASNAKAVAGSVAASKAPPRTCTAPSTG